MQIGIISDSFPPTVGGIENFVGSYVEALAGAEGVQSVDVFTFSSGEVEMPENVTIRRSTAPNTISRLKQGLSWALAGNFDVLHSMTLYPSGLVPAIAGLVTDVDRTFVTVYGTDALATSERLRTRVPRQLIFGSVDEVLFLSKSTQSKTQAAYGEWFSTRQIYPGTPSLTEPAADPPIPDTAGDFTLISVARLVKRKAIDDLIKAVASLPDIELWIVGDGPERSALSKQVTAAGAEDRIAFLGSVSDAELTSLYQSADAFCMPSKYLEAQGDIEGLGLVFLEAQQLGLPVIGTDSGGIPEAIADGESGLVVPEGSPADIRDGIQTLSQDPDLYRAFSDGAASFVSQRFSWNRCVSEHIKAYQ